MRLHSPQFQQSAGATPSQVSLGTQMFSQRDQRGVLLTVETEVTVGSYGVQMKGVLPWLVHWARRAGTKDFYPALAAPVSPVQNTFFLTIHYKVNLCVPTAQQPGLPVVQGHLSIIILEIIATYCLCLRYT